MSSLEYVSHLPSGDHWGMLNPLNCEVSSGVTTFVATSTLLRVPLEVVKAISLLSGDHDIANFNASILVICFASPVPSLLITWISSRPLRSETNEIHFPSGEYITDRSRAELFVI